MKVLIGGLPYFAKKLVNSLTDFDEENSYNYLEPPVNLYHKLKTIFKLLNSDIVYFIWGTIDNSKLINLALFMNKKVAMHWVGHDVTYAINNCHEKTINPKYITEIFHFCEVSWIQSELKLLGIDSQMLQIATFEEKVSEIPKLPSLFSILSYVGVGEEEFYGINYLIQLAIDFPGIEIKIAGIDQYNKVLPVNIKLLGWTKNMQNEYNNCVLYLRLPEHDGLSFSVLEALANGRYVGYTCNFHNTFLVNNYSKLKDLVGNLLNEFNKGSLGLNRKGVEFIKENYSKESVLGELLKELEVR